MLCELVRWHGGLPSHVGRDWEWRPWHCPRWSVATGSKHQKNRPNQYLVRTRWRWSFLSIVWDMLNSPCTWTNLVQVHSCRAAGWSPSTLYVPTCHTLSAYDARQIIPGTKVLISGGGVAGSVLAFWLSKLGHGLYGVEVMTRMGL